MCQNVSKWIVEQSRFIKNEKQIVRMRNSDDHVFPHQMHKFIVYLGYFNRLKFKYKDMMREQNP